MRENHSNYPYLVRILDMRGNSIANTAFFGSYSEANRFFLYQHKSIRVRHDIRLYRQNFQKIDNLIYSTHQIIKTAIRL